MRSENLRRPLQPRRHPAAPRQHPAASSGIQRHPGDTPERPGHHSSTSFYGSVKSPSMHHRSLYLSF